MKKASQNYRKKRMRRLYAALIIISLIISLSLSGGYMAYSYITGIVDRTNEEADIQIELSEAIEVEVPLGSTTQDIITILEEMGIVNKPSVFKILSKINGYDGKYKSGTHLVRAAGDYNSLKGYDDLMRILSARPLDNPTIDITIPEGYSYLQIRQLLVENDVVDAAELDRVVNEEEFEYPFIDGIPQDREFRLEGYLFPETYTFDLKKGPVHIVGKMLVQFNKIFPEPFYKKAEDLGMTVDEIITMASIVEKEVQDPAEKYIVAGIFYNRLKSSEAYLRYLQSCATLQYIYFKEEGKVKEQITQEDTLIDNPYNTYKYPGLPPGPICNPGLQSIRAVLFPEETNYLYFVSFQQYLQGACQCHEKIWSAFGMKLRRANLLCNHETTEFIRKIIKKSSGVLKEIEEQALKKSVPIIEPEVTRFLSVAVRMAGPKRVLEIGTATGYSAVVICDAAGEDVRMDTVENSEPMVLEARKNIKAAGYEKNINVIFGNAAEVLTVLSGTYDFIFVDAAKGMYGVFLPECLRLLGSGGVMVSDNVLYRGMVCSRKKVPRRERTAVNRLKKYLGAICTDPSLDTTILPLGDGISVSYRV